MDNNKKIRLICGLVIVVGFFLPWLDLGEMGEMMSGLAAMTGEEMSSAPSGFKLATGGAGPINDDDFGTMLWAIPILGMIAALVNSRGLLIILPILAIGVMLLFAPALNSMGADSGMNGWAIGKVLSLVGLIALILTGFGDSVKKEDTTLEDF